MEVCKLYSMYYDNKELGNNGLGDYLGEFRRVRQLREDFYVDDFLAVNIETNELCLILSREIKGVGGGISYSVHPMKTLGTYKINGEIDFAEWKMVLDDFALSHQQDSRCCMVSYPHARRPLRQYA